MQNLKIDTTPDITTEPELYYTTTVYEGEVRDGLAYGKYVLSNLFFKGKIN